MVYFGGFFAKLEFSRGFLYLLLLILPFIYIPLPSVCLKVHKIEIFFGFDFEICIISLLVMSDLSNV